MAITTVFSTEFSISTSFQILVEFILSYISNDDVDITDEMPSLLESSDLTKPIIYLQLYPGSEKMTGMGQSVNGGKGKFQNFSYMLNIVVSNNCGGTLAAKQLAEKLRWIFLKYSKDLVDVGFKLPMCGTFREIPEDSNNPVFGGRMLVSFKALLIF